MNPHKMAFCAIFLLATLGACGPDVSQPVILPTDTSSSPVIAGTPSKPAIDESSASTTPFAQLTLDNVSSATLTSSVSSSVAASLTQPAETVPLPLGGEDMVLTEFCNIPDKIEVSKDDEEIYFQSTGGWYRTADEFTTSTWIAPEGYLSRDLKYLVTVDCQGVGTICIASPPTAEPQLLSSTYEHQYDPGDPKTLPGNHAVWMSDNKRLILGVGEVVNETHWETHLYLLNAETHDLTELARDYGEWFSVSPVGDCIALPTREIRETAEVQFEIMALRQDGTQDVWIASPASEDGSLVWPDFSAFVEWSPSGQQLAFSRFPTPDQREQFRIWDLQSRMQQGYTVCDRCIAYMIHWSPDGDHLYIDSSPMQWIYSFDTNKFTRLPETRAIGSSTSNQWMPDSRRLILADPIYGSQMFSIVDGTITQLKYPGQEQGWPITDLFWVSGDKSTTSSTLTD